LGGSPKGDDGGLGGSPKSDDGGLGGSPKNDDGGLGGSPKSDDGGLGGSPKNISVTGEAARATRGATRNHPRGLNSDPHPRFPDTRVLRRTIVPQEVRDGMSDGMSWYQLAKCAAHGLPWADGAAGPEAERLGLDPQSLCFMPRPLQTYYLDRTDDFDQIFEVAEVSQPRLIVVDS